MAGRPKKPDPAVRDTILRVRLTDAERALIDQATATKALDTSAWARSLLLEQARRLTKDRDEAGA